MRPELIVAVTIAGSVLCACPAQWNGAQDAAFRPEADGGTSIGTDAGEVAARPRPPWEAQTAIDIGLTCGDWVAYEAKDLGSLCPSPVMAFGHSWFVTLDYSFASACVFSPTHYKVLHLSRKLHGFGRMVAHDGRIYSSLIQIEADGEALWPIVSIDPESCRAWQVLAAGAPGDERVSLAASDSNLVMAWYEKATQDFGVLSIDFGSGTVSQIELPKEMVPPTIKGESRPATHSGVTTFQTGGDGNRDVRVFYLSDLQAPKPVGGTAAQMSPDTYDGWVAWEDYRKGDVTATQLINPDVWALNVATGEVWEIAGGQHFERLPVVLPGAICWMDLRNGSVSGSGLEVNPDLYCRRLADWAEFKLAGSAEDEFGLTRLDWGVGWISGRGRTTRLNVLSASEFALRLE